MRMYLLQEAGTDSCEESRKGPSIKNKTKQNKTKTKTNRFKRDGVALGIFPKRKNV